MIFNSGVAEPGQAAPGRWWRGVAGCGGVVATRGPRWRRAGRGAAKRCGSFLTRLASANRIRIWHLLQLTAINVQQQREFTPATDDWLGWSPWRTGTS